MALDPLNPPKANYAEAAATVLTPAFGTVGMPVGVKETAQRADFRPDSFTIAIEGHGYRLAWTRASFCPCVPLNSQTSQSDPNCPVCQGSGYYYFGPPSPQDAALVGALTPAQKALVANAFVIRGIMTSIGTEHAPFEKVGGWRTGTANLTVRPENRLAYYDKLVAIDSTIVYSELVVVPTGGGRVLPTRYLVDGGVNLIASLTKRYLPNIDYLVEDGAIKWMSATRVPLPGTRLAVHYFTHPTWLVMSYPHTVRDTNIAYKKPIAQTPEGDNFNLPIAATVKLEWLVHDSP